MNKEILKTAAYVDQQTGSVDHKFIKRVSENDPELASEIKIQEDMSKLLRSSGKRHQTDATPEFFWSQVQKQIAGEEARKRNRFSKESILRVLGLYWAPAFAILLVVCSVMLLPEFNHSQRYAKVLDARTSLDKVSVTPIQSKKSGVTVIWIEGLDYLPANPDILKDAS
ncbi:MAG: hypothetical protein SGI98_10175 [Verrucomicrobiota bacterium]|nr:hypothetical protein [Verrucomicrobiota bacterium]